MTKSAQVVFCKHIVPDDDRPDRDIGNNLWLGVMARATIKIPYGHDWITTHVDSPGLWGVEVETSADPYLDAIYEEELRTLRDILQSLRTIEIPGEDNSQPSSKGGLGAILPR